MKKIMISPRHLIFPCLQVPMIWFFGILMAGVPARLAAQNFTAPGSLDEFSDVMVEQPNTAMVILPGVPADTPPAEAPATGDPAATPPPECFSPELPETVGNYEGPIGVTGIFNGNVTTGCSYDPSNHSAHRAIDDLVVPGSIGKYPLKMTRYYNSRQQYYALSAIGLGPGWAHEYSWLLWGAGKKVVSPRGNAYDFSCSGAPPTGVSEWWEGPRPCATPCPSPGTGTWRLADGGRVRFENYKVTYIDDPYGMRTRIAYNQSGPQAGQRVKVTEPGGRCLWFIYGEQNQGNTWGDGTWLLTRVEAYDSDGYPGFPTFPNGNLVGWVNYSYQAYDPLDPEHPGNRRQKMLIRVDYPNSSADLTDATHAHYDYRTDNVPENQNSRKWYPLLERADDVRYNGPMRTIRYEYQNHTPHGAIINEKYPDVGPVSAMSPAPTFGPPTLDTFTETRGDGPKRTFTYTHLRQCQASDCGVCDDYENNHPPQQMLDHYTDFYTPGSQGHTTQLGYNENWYINSVTDAKGHQTRYDRGDPPPNGIGEIKRVIPPGGSYPDGFYVEYIYSDHGHYITSVRDENGHVTNISRDNNNRITRIDYPSDVNTPASYEAFSNFDIFGHARTHQFKNTAYESFVYDGRGLLIHKYNPKLGSVPSGNDPHVHYDYYTAADGKLGWIDRIKTVKMPANFPFGYQATETYEYDRDSSNQPCAGRGLVTKITHTDGTYQSFRYDQWGNKIDEWDELAQHTGYTYDSYNRVTSMSRGNETTSYTYNPTNGTSPYLHTTNNARTVTSPTNIVTTNDYDENFRKTSSSVADRTTWFHYDAVGNQDHVTDPRGAHGCDPDGCDPTYTTSIEYDSRNRKWHVDDAQNHRTTFTYDNASNVLRIDRPGDNWEAKTYDALNRVRNHTVSFKSGTPPVNLTTWFTYNPSGTIWKVTDARGSGRGDPTYTTTFEYNASDERILMTYPPVNNQSDTQAWQYDDAHNLELHIMPGGHARSFAYDQRNRNYEQFWWDIQGNSFWYYFGLDGPSRLRDAKNGTGPDVNNNTISRVHREYDAINRITLDRQTIVDQPNGPGLPVKYVNYEYDKSLRGTVGNPTRISVSPTPNPGYDYDLRYDDMGRFEEILLHTNGSLQFQYSYDPASNERQRHNQVTGVDEVYNPDSLNRPTTVDLKRNGARFALESYDYHVTGRLHTTTRLDNKHDEFAYYLNGELFWVNYGVPEGEAPNPNEIPPADDPTKEKTPEDFLSLSGWNPNEALTASRWVRYNLDYAGNRNSVNDSVNGYSVYTPDNLNRYVDQVGNDPVTYGNKHEVTSYKNINYTYKDEHLVSVVNPTTNDSYQFAYDALGRCVKRTVNGLTKYYIYDGERPILEYGVAGNVRGKNLYGKGIDEILMRWDPTVTDNGLKTFYYQRDHEGSITHLTRPDGTVFERYRYDAFGTPTIWDGNWTLRTASAVSNRFMFTGREYNAAFGFYEYRARAYHPGLGRFMSEDPKLFVRRAGIGAAAADWTFAAHPDEAEFNLFRYCGNDPIDFTDPTGLMPDALVAEPEGRSVAPAVVLGHAAIIGVLAAPAAEAAVGRAAVAAILRSSTLARLVGISAAASRSQVADKVKGTLMPSGRIGEVVFWSGRQGANRAAAEAFARSTGKTTLEMTPAGRALEAAGGNISQWKTLSASAARSAVGEVNSFAGGARPEGVWNTVEKPLLMRNPNVTKIIIRDAVQTSKTTIVYP